MYKYGILKTREKKASSSEKAFTRSTKGGNNDKISFTVDLRVDKNKTLKNLNFQITSF